MNTETDLLTEYEKKILRQREKVRDRYLELQKLYPVFTPWRYIKKISAEMSLTEVGVYKMVIDMGLYIPKSKRNERDTAVTGGDSVSQNRNTGAEKFADCEL